MEEHPFIARYASVCVTGSSFAEVGDVLAARGFDMVRATQTARGVLVVPHKRPDRQAAHVYRQVPKVNGVEKPEPEIPMQVDVAAAMLKTAEIESGLREPIIGLQCRECGAVHPEGVVCLVPIFFEVECHHCGREECYTHPGPHEHADHEGVITHRWVTEMVIKDLPYDGYMRVDWQAVEDAQLEED